MKKAGVPATPKVIDRRWPVSELVRFSVSLESDLLERFDRLCEAGRYETRSDAVRQLIHERLTSHAWATDAADVAASLTLVYDHHKTRLTDRMLDLQHEHADRVVSSMHVHLTHELCMEVIVLRGPAVELQHLAAELSGMKGIHQAQLVIIRADESNHRGHRHEHRHR
jgi:CopG family nickel-responsive transcriptional regulator